MKPLSTDLAEGGHFGTHGRLVPENGVLLDGVVEKDRLICPTGRVVQSRHLRENVRRDAANEHTNIVLMYTVNSGPEGDAASPGQQFRTVG